MHEGKLLVVVLCNRYRIAARYFQDMREEGVYEGKARP